MSSTKSTGKRKKEQEAPVKAEAADETAKHLDVKPKIKKTSTGKGKKKGGQPPGFRVLTAQNSSGRPGLCKVLVKANGGGDSAASAATDSQDKKMLDRMDDSPGFLYLNDKGAKGFSVTATPDTIEILDQAFFAVVDKLLINGFYVHYQLDKQGLSTTSTGTIVHPKESAAQDKSLSKKGEYTLRPRTLALAVQMDESLRHLFGDAKLPDDTRPPLVFGATVTAEEPETKGKKGGKATSSAKKGSPAVSSSEAHLSKVLTDYSIKL